MASSESVRIGPQAATGASAAGEWTPGLVRTMYLDLYRRPPFDVERTRLLEPAALDDSASGALPTEIPARSRSELARSLVGRPDFWRPWYEEQLYFFLLVDNFAPHAEGLLSIPAELAEGKLHVREAIHRIALSSSFDQRNPGADTFVTVVMEQIAGLAVDKHRRELEIGKAAYDGKSGSFLGQPCSSQSDVVRAAIEQRAFAESFLTREYRRYVHAKPDARELATWVQSFLTDPHVFPRLVSAWIESPEYSSRLARREPMDNRLFVRSLLADVCRREPTGEEYSRMRSALDGLSDPLPLRSVMARLLLDSDQAQLGVTRSGTSAGDVVRDAFVRLLGREPDTQEAAVFAAGLADPAGSAKLVVFALVTHPEYQSY